MMKKVLGLNKPPKALAWCVTVGTGGNAYIMDNKTFDKKAEAIKYRAEAGYPDKVEWSKHWHITKLIAAN